MIEHLKKLGLTELEARCYIALNEKPDQTGYEVAKMLGASRSNVYAALKTMHQKGICQSAEGSSTTYSAISIDDFIAKQKLEFRESAIFLKRAIQNREKKQYRVFNTEGFDSVMSIVKRSIARAHHHVLVQIAKADITYFLPTLEYIQTEGIQVTLQTDEQLATTLQHVTLHPLNHGAIRTFTIIIDHRKIITGSLDEHVIPSAVESVHPALVTQAIQSFKYIQLLEQLKIKDPDFITAWHQSDIMS
ncbi:transcriptional regulator [Lysinibacillus alkalisoli]|uniref:Transcriptional regulator n=1 Tax=Lysinibacillus alkalisoli TaxID=1911548 RepID=A0A917G1L4_9BACI|nr:TrmB family transcriptional regulator [Lysinibacillus alkalisoli]GGG18365.1 transcriptional regulator [Lysinibacillus alkalisoli]